MKESRSFWQTLRSFRGNQRAALAVEPLWAVPYNLFLPFAAVYMTAIGLTDAQIGALASLGLAMQFFWAIFSGAIVDKLGRRGTMLLFGILSWSVPCAFWAAAQGYWWFVAAVAFNSMWRVSGNSFGCLMIEDNEEEKLVYLYTILSLIGLCTGFFSPAVGAAINRFSLTATMRVLYVFAAVSMAVKHVLQIRNSRESRVGVARMRESKGRSMLSLTFGGWRAFVSALRNPRLLLLIGLMALANCFNTVQGTFWPLFITTAYGVDAPMLSWFPPVKALVTAAVFLFLTSRISLRAVRMPLLSGLAAQALGLAVLLACRLLGAAAIAAVFFSAVCDAFALAVLGPLCESLLAVTIPPQERARIYSLIIGAIILVSMPIGWIGGWLSQQNRMLPLALNLGLLAAEFLLALRIARVQKRDGEAGGSPAC